MARDSQPRHDLARARPVVSPGPREGSRPGDGDGVPPSQGGPEVAGSTDHARDLTAPIYIAGHRGMVGSALVRRLTALGYTNLLTATHAELDLLDQAAVNRFFADHAIDQVYLAAARVGGIHANNTYPADFIYQNLMIEANLIQAAHAHGVQKLLFLGSSCIYPQLAPQPMAEAALLTGTLEPTNEPYAIAKIAGIKLCESYNRQHGRDYRSVMPTNLYGPGDNYHPENSHVIPALLRRFHEAVCTGADQVTIWGSGTPRREFLHVDDMAAACVHVMALAPASYQAHTRPMLSHVPTIAAFLAMTTAMASPSGISRLIIAIGIQAMRVSLFASSVRSVCCRIFFVMWMPGWRWSHDG